MTKAITVIFFSISLLAIGCKQKQGASDAKAGYSEQAVKQLSQASISSESKEENSNEQVILIVDSVEKKNSGDPKLAVRKWEQYRTVGSAYTAKAWGFRSSYTLNFGCLNGGGKPIVLETNFWNNVVHTYYSGGDCEKIGSDILKMFNAKRDDQYLEIIFQPKNRSMIARLLTKQ